MMINPGILNSMHNYVKENIMQPEVVENTIDAFHSTESGLQSGLPHGIQQSYVR